MDILLCYIISDIDKQMAKNLHRRRCRRKMSKDSLDPELKDKRLSPPCGIIPQRELLIWRMNVIAEKVKSGANALAEIPLDLVREYNEIGEKLFPDMFGPNEIAGFMPDGSISVGRRGEIGPRGITNSDLVRYYQYDREWCYPCERCKGKKPGTYGLP